jgi:hypothetical protein
MKSTSSKKTATRLRSSLRTTRPRQRAKMRPGWKGRPTKGKLTWTSASTGGTGPPASTSEAPVALMFSWSGECTSGSWRPFQLASASSEMGSR